MAGPIKRSFDAPDQHVDVPGVVADVVEVGDSTISRFSFDPGTHCPQISLEGKRYCLAHHSGYAMAGHLHVEMQDGSTIDVEPNDVFDVPPGHDGWATGSTPFLAVSWAGFHSWVAERSGERVLLTLLVTDVVGSTVRAVAMGDHAWRQLLAQHHRAVRETLDRYRGREVNSAGDGFLAAFDGPGRAIAAAVTLRERAARDGLSIRAGVHSGEVEIVGEDLAGVAVHEVARIAAAAAENEILVSEATRLLAEGAAGASSPGGFELKFEARGPYELKGLPGQRTLYAVTPGQGG